MIRSRGLSAAMHAKLPDVFLDDFCRPGHRWNPLGSSVDSSGMSCARPEVPSVRSIYHVQQRILRRAALISKSSGYSHTL